MKKTFFKITLSVLSMFGLASCLGDSSSYTSGEGFAYVATDQTTFTPYLVVLSGYAYPIKTPVLDGSGLERGDCAYITFKIYPEKVSGTAYYTEEVTILSKYYSNDHLRFKMTTPPAVSESDTINVFQGIVLQSASSNDIIKDKWLIRYKTSLQKDQKEVLSLYYDGERQPEIDKNIIYVDVRVAKLDPKDGVKYDASEKNIVADFTPLRSILLGTAPEKTAYKIYFRYYTLGKDDKTNQTKAVEVSSTNGGALYKEEEPKG